MCFSQNAGVTETKVDSYHPKLDNIYGAQQAADQQLDYSGFASDVMKQMLGGALKGAGYNYSGNLNDAGNSGQQTTASVSSIDEQKLFNEVLADYNESMTGNNINMNYTGYDGDGIRDQWIKLAKDKLTKEQPLGSGYDYDSLLFKATQYGHGGKYGGSPDHDRPDGR